MTEKIQHLTDRRRYIIRNVVPGKKKIESDISRVFFSKLALDGLDDMYEYSCMPEFYSFMEMPPHNSKEDTRNYILKLLDRMDKGYSGGEAMYWFIRLSSSKKIIGSIGLVGIDFRVGRAEVGEGLSPKYWGKGYMSEAFGIFLNYCFKLLELERLQSITRYDNLPNIKLNEKAGFKKEGRLRNYYLKYSGKKYDAVLYGQLGDEYLSRGI